MPVYYLPHVIYSTALTSLSFHLLFHKRQVEVDRAHLTAQISILESLIQQLRSGQNITDEEIDRLSRLAKTHEDSESTGVRREASKKIGWREVFLGRRMESGGVQVESEDFKLEQGEFWHISRFITPAHFTRQTRFREIMTGPCSPSSSLKSVKLQGV